jgi:Caspase domain
MAYLIKGLQMSKTVISLFLALCICISLQAENKTALLVANGNYNDFSNLNQPIPEAQALKASLERLDFQVTLLTDASREEILDGLMDFEDQIKHRGGIAFFHYGGHAVQVDGRNYLLPANASIPDERRVSTRAVDAAEVMSTLEVAGGETNIVILDSCRNNPLSGSGRSATRGLAVVDRKPPNSIIVYSAESGTVAQDGVFTPTLIKYLEDPKLSFTEILRKTRMKVYEITNGAQVPGAYDQLFKAVYLNEKKTEIPEWLLNPPMSEDAIFGIGIAKMESSEKTALNSVMSALTDISMQVETTITTAVSNYFQESDYSSDPIQSLSSLKISNMEIFQSIVESSDKTGNMTSYEMTMKMTIQHKGTAVTIESSVIEKGNSIIRDDFTITPQVPPIQLILKINEELDSIGASIEFYYSPDGTVFTLISYPLRLLVEQIEEIFLRDEDAEFEEFKAE